MNLPNGTDAIPYSELFGDGSGKLKADENGDIKVNQMVLMCIMSDLEWAKGKLEGIEEARSWLKESEQRNESK